MLAVRLIGPFAVTRDGVAVERAELGSRKGRELLALLAVERGRTVPVDRIVEVLWAGTSPKDPTASVATLVSRLRRALGVEVVRGGRNGYRLGHPPGVLVDLDEASRWIDEAERRTTAGEAALGVSAGLRSVELLSADGVLVDEPAAEWMEPARGEVVELLRRSRHVLADAALATGDHVLATRTAEAAVAADPYDEPARRALMSAHLAAGEPARALSTYADLQQLLASGLGVDPASETRLLHLAILRQEQPPATQVMTSVAAPVSDTLGLVGRTEQLRRLRSAWNAAAAGSPGLVLVVGEAGIGKTRLVDELARIATSTGGTVLAARCYSSERSLFLQPVVEAASAAVRALPPQVLIELVGDHGPALSHLLPEVAVALAPPQTRRDSADVERRRAFEAVTALIRRLGDRAPVLVVLDDLQNAGLSTAELLHYLARHAPRGRVLVVGTVRVEEGSDVIDLLTDVSERIELGPLPIDAVTRLAAAAGWADRADDIMSRTSGHALFVVETLRALVAGITGIPESLEVAVLARVRRAGPQVDELLRAAAVLGVSFDPVVVAGLLGQPLGQVLRTCADALAARLLVVVGRDYEFANDVVRDVLYATTPLPTTRIYHQSAADLLTARPEAVAAHASAAQDWPRAARAWLRAGEDALRRAATADAVELVSRALEIADPVGDLEIRARALVVRGRARTARTEYASAREDIELAALAAREAGDQRLEVVALRALGGEVSIGLGRPIAECLQYLERGLALATSMSDRAMEADLRAWMAVLAANGLRFADAVEYGRLAVTAARASGADEALAAALDGQKTSLAYLGETGPLGTVIDELEPLLRRIGDFYRLHWAVFESAFSAVAAGDWAAASVRIEAAIEINKRSGYSAYVAWHVAHLGWLARLTGRYDDALVLGRHALESSHQTPHIWCAAVAGALLGTTLLEVGNVDEAVEVLEAARVAAQQDGANAYLLRVLSPLAEASGSRAVLVEAADLLGRITAPPGGAFLAGDACYFAVARSWLACGEPQRARDVLAPLLVAAARVPWVGALAEGSLVDGRAAWQLGQQDEADRLLRRAIDLGVRYHLPRVAREGGSALDLLVLS
jgi:DNA-binding SARP family transcriptional activator/tetratricopeptide (TPR) repeat protein